MLPWKSELINALVCSDCRTSQIIVFQIKMSNALVIIFIQIFIGTFCIQTTRHL
jgi:hypothetical protein